MKYNTFLFDFDYTLVNSSAGIVKCFRIVLDRHDYKEPTDEQIRRTIGKTLEESFSILTGVNDADTLSTYRKEYVAEADKYMTSNTFLFPETKEVLTTLKENGAKLGIISTKYKYRIKEFLDLNFPEDFFDIIIGIEEVDKYKPHPDGIFKAIKTLKSQKSQTIYIGDSIADAEAAQNAEIDFIGVTHGVTTTRELAAFQNVAIVPDLTPILSFATKKSLVKLLRKDKRDTLKRFLVYRKHIGVTKSLDPYKHYVCKNCGTYFAGEYCNTCGQRRNTRRFTFGYVIKNVLGGLTNIDDGFTRNLVELLYRPGYMIIDYIKGKRSHYFKPFQTLFVLAAIYIILVQVTDPLAFVETKSDATYSSVKSGIESINKKSNSQKAKTFLTKSNNYIDSAYAVAPIQEKDNKDKVNIQIDNSNRATKYISAFARTLARIFNSDKVVADDNPTFFDGLINIIENWTKDNKSFSLILLIPLYAFATRKAFRKNPISREFNYTEHLFIQVYIACQIVIISILLIPFLGHGKLDDAFGVSWWLVFLLYWWDFRQLFKYSWKKTFFKSVVMFIYLGILILSAAIGISIFVGFWTILFT